MNRFSRATLLVALGGALMLAGACSSSSSGGGGGGGASTSAGAQSTVPSQDSGAPAPAGAAIKLGTICSCSGVQSASLALAQDGADSWAKAVSAAGGINGHPVQLIMKDDAGNPSTALQAVKALVEQDKVMAIVGANSLQDESWASYVASKGVPVVGGLPDLPFSSNPDFFTEGSSVAVLTVGQMQLMKKQGKSKFGLLYCAESPVCAQLEGLAKAAASVVGGISVTAGKVAATSPTYTSQCLAMKSAGVDGLDVANNSATILRVLGDCKKLGYSPLNVAQSNVIANGWLKDSNTENSAISSSSVNYQDSSVPAVKEFLDALGKYHSGDLTSDQFTPPVFFSWIGGKLFQAAATKASLGPTSTPADVKKALYALKDETLGGVVPPLNFEAGKPGFPTCYFSMSVENGKYTSPDGTKPICLSATEVAGLVKALGGK